MSSGSKLSDVFQGTTLIDRLDEVLPGLIYVYDLVERRNVYANRPLTLLLGYSRPEVEALGDQILATIIHPEDLPHAVAHHAPLHLALEIRSLRALAHLRHRPRCNASPRHRGGAAREPPEAGRFRALEDLIGKKTPLDFATGSDHFVMKTEAVQPR
jgi:PAS domain-containing protein